MPYYVYNTTRIVTAVEGEPFLTTGTTVVDKGWMALEVSNKKEKKKDALPDVSKAEEVKTTSVKAVAKKTKPPVPYNEAGLLSAMENAGRFVEDEELKEQLKDSGLGTPATRAGIIERLIQVKYIERKGKNIVPTEKGIKLIQIVPEELKSPVTTGKWEKALGTIAKGSTDSKIFMDGIKRYVSYIITKSNQETKPVLFAADKPRGKRAGAAVLGVCPACKGHILENSKGYFCSNWKQGCKFTIWKNSLENYGLSVNNDMVKKLLGKEGKMNVTLYKNGTDEKYDCCLSLRGDNSGRINAEIKKAE
jgi:DNA topoisomerase-3